MLPSRSLPLKKNVNDFLDILFNVRTIAGLEQDQPVRKYQDPEGYNQLQEIYPFFL